jgi:hypothetical protein
LLFGNKAIKKLYPRIFWFEPFPALLNCDLSRSFLYELTTSPTATIATKKTSQLEAAALKDYSNVISSHSGDNQVLGLYLQELGHLPRSSNVAGK